MVAPMINGNGFTGKFRPGSMRAAWHGNAVPSGVIVRKIEPKPFMQGFGRLSK